MVAGTLSALCFAAAGATIGALAGSAPGGGAVGALLGGVVAGALGVVFGRAVARAGVYRRSPTGVALFLLDHTWSWPNTAAGAAFLAGNLLRGNRVVPELCRHTGTVHLAHGVAPGYLTTIGTVIAGVDPAVHPHEHGHVLQARLFGPLYLPLVALSFAVATVVPYWLVWHDREQQPVNSLRGYFLAGVYPNTWHEAWCYKVYGPQR